MTISGGVHKVPPVDVEPVIRLARWRVFEVAPGGTRHLVGWHIDGHEGRVSSAITEFDPASRKVKTRSGRTYLLAHGPGASTDAEYVWSAFKRVNGVNEATEVTEEYV